MTSRNDLKVVRDEIVSADRRRLGDPPSVDEVLSYSRGELSAAAEARVRELLACYPELADALTIPFGEPGESLPDEVIAHQWKSFREQLPTPRPRRVWQAATAMAAALALTFGALLWNALQELREPRAIAAEHVLDTSPERGGRGGAETILLADAGDVVLTAPLHDHPEFPRYRVDVLEIAGASRRQRWSTTTTARDPHVLRVLIPGGSLEPGEYELVVNGLSGERPHELVRYGIRVEKR
jgi:hypothetical protein